MWLKNVDPYLSNGMCLVASLARMLRRVSNPTDRTLIIRPGGMGDLICCHIALRALGADLGNIDWLIEKRSEPWAQLHGFRYLCYDRDIPTLVSKVGTYKAVVNTEQRFGLSMAAAIALCHFRGSIASFETNLRSAWASSTVEYDAFGTHEVNCFADLLRTTSLPSSLLFNPGGLPFLRKGLVVGVAGTESDSRRLSVDEWSFLIEKTVGRTDFSIVGHPKDLRLMQRVAARFKDQCEIFTGTFPEICRLVSECERLITIDGGLVHVASFYNTPATVLFTSSREEKWKPLAPGSTVLLNRKLKCRPCALFAQVPDCPHEYQCKDLKSWMQVL